jgi:hypothetical protein
MNYVFKIVLAESQPLVQLFLSRLKLKVGTNVTSSVCKRLEPLVSGGNKTNGAVRLKEAGGCSDLQWARARRPPASQDYA